MHIIIWPPGVPETQSLLYITCSYNLTCDTCIYGISIESIFEYWDRANMLAGLLSNLFNQENTIRQI